MLGESVTVVQMLRIGIGWTTELYVGSGTGIGMGVDEGGWRCKGGIGGGGGGDGGRRAKYVSCDEDSKHIPGSILGLRESVPGSTLRKSSRD